MIGSFARRNTPLCGARASLDATTPPQMQGLPPPQLKPHAAAQRGASQLSPCPQHPAAVRTGPSPRVTTAGGPHTAALPSGRHCPKASQGPLTQDLGKAGILVLLARPATTNRVGGLCSHTQGALADTALWQACGGGYDGSQTTMDPRMLRRRWRAGCMTVIVCGAVSPKQDPREREAVEGALESINTPWVH